MHIADGVLSPEVCGATAIVSGAAVAYSIKQMRDSLSDRIVPLTGMMAAVVFAGQMVNFPLIGTMVSGHLMGGVLAAIVLGPWAGCLALTLVLTVQCLLFSDGGLLSLGANTLHMAVVGPIGGYCVFVCVRRLLGDGVRGTVTGGVVAAWFSVMAAAFLFCLEFRASWPSADYDFSKIFTLMATFHSGIGLGEALITGVAIGAVCQHRPSLIGVSHAAPAGVGGQLIGCGLMVALAIAAFLSPFASGRPDGLEFVAEQADFARLEQTHASLLDDYELPALDSVSEVSQWQIISVSIAGIGGTVAVFALAYALSGVVSRRSQITKPLDTSTNE